MVTKDRQVRLLMENLKNGDTLKVAAAKSGMCENTARKWRDSGRLPSQCRKQRTWRTRKDPFEEVWDEAREMLDIEPGLEAKTIFQFLQRKYPGRFQDGQLRTFQRRVKCWRALEGPPREVFFPQVHTPGILAESDFTRMNKLNITIAGEPFKHLFFHFVLTYSNWETGDICFSECFEALSEGTQNAFWELGGVTEKYRTDQLSTAVHKVEHPDQFTERYQALLDNLGVKGEKIQAGEAHENGDIEQAHYRFKQAVDQELMLRGSRDFSSVTEYRRFLRTVINRLNAGRRERFEEERKILKPLPQRRLDDFDREKVRVRSSSTIRCKKNTYSVNSRLIGERVEARIYMDHIEILYAQKCVEMIPRLRGTGKHCINYRHVIPTLIRKPGAFANYRYREDMFPTITFRMAYDHLRGRKSEYRADREYLKILYLAAMESEERVENALRLLLKTGDAIRAEVVGEMVKSDNGIPSPVEVTVETIDLTAYDRLLVGVRS